MRHPANAYRQFSVQTATPLGLVVMLYDGAIAAMQRAVTAIEARDIPKKCNHLNRAQAIIMQLEGTLNFELGGEVAQTLKTLYVYARTQMLKANIENSPEILCALIEKISIVREAWYEADHRPATVPVNAPSNSPTPLPSTSARGRSPREAWYEAEPLPSTSPPEPAGDGYSPSATREPGTWRMSA